MLRALDCSAFILLSPPRTFSDSVGFTPALAPLGTVYQRLGPLPPRSRGCAHHRPASGHAQDLPASQSPLPSRGSRLSTLPIQTYDRATVSDARHDQRAGPTIAQLSADAATYAVTRPRRQPRSLSNSWEQRLSLRFRLALLTLFTLPVI